MVAKKPRVIIIGAGMAGLSAAWQLMRTTEDSMFDLTVLEASNRIGGRINTSEFGGNTVELGATWIHGVEGSPLYKIAQETGATVMSGPFERQDGFPGEPTVKAEGGLTVPGSIVSPIRALYLKLLELVRSHEKLESALIPLSIGAFVAQGFQAFLSQQQSSSSNQMEGLLFDCWPAYKSSWTLKSLQEALLCMYENMECVDTSANTLHDLDLQAEKEYADYPGEHVTIPKGYMSIINELAASLPASLIQFGKKVEKILWNRIQQPPVAIHCSDGSVYEADHVIITMSLGVLKAGIKLEGTPPWTNLEGRFVCRSVGSLQARTLAPKQQESKNVSLFEPPLPACKVQAISRLGYGLVNKLFLQLNTSVLSSLQLQQLNSHIQLVYKSCKELRDPSIPHWMRRTFSISPIYNGSSVLLCWFAGNEALEIEALSDEEIMSGVARTLASFGVSCRQSSGKQGHKKRRDSGFSSGSDSEDSLSRGESLSSSSSDSEENFDEEDGSLHSSEEDFRKMFCRVLRSKWGRDPLFRGSYSFVATGSSGDDIEKLAEPLPQICSANCACNATGVYNDHNLDNYGAINATNYNASSARHQAIEEACSARDGVRHAYIHTERGAPEIVMSGGTDRSGSICESSKEQTVPSRCERCEEEEVVGGKAPLQLLFAGEATVRAVYSTTHGAHLSGLREANRLLNLYSLSLIAPS